MLDKYVKQAYINATGNGYYLDTMTALERTINELHNIVNKAM